MPRFHDALIAIIAAVSLYFIGMALSFFLNLDLPLVAINVFPPIDLLLFGLAVFVFSMLFFGGLIPLFFLLVGASQASVLAETPVLLVINSIPLFFFGFLGTWFGRLLRDDLSGKDNVFNYKRQLLVLFTASIIIAIVLGLLKNEILQLDAMFLGLLGK